MKHTAFYTALFLSLLLTGSCKDVIFIPVKGSISGYIADNNGTPMAGIQVSAAFSTPGQSSGQPPSPTTLTATSDKDGYYRLSDVWDEVHLSVNASGFLPVTTRIDLGDNSHPALDITLSGSPTIGAVSLSKTVLSEMTADTAIISMEVRDVFNLNSQGYTGNFLLKADNSVTKIIIPAILLSQSLEQYLFKSLITSPDLPAGNYDLIAEVRDPDGNMHQISTGQTITIK